MDIGTLSKTATIPLVLAGRILSIIEDSGAARTEVHLALGIVQAVFPALEISTINEDEQNASSQP